MSSKLPVPSRVRRASRPAKAPSSDRAAGALNRWADFADIVLEIAREIQFHGHASPVTLSLTTSEGTAMRYLLQHPRALSSEVADATGLQRSNLSAVLRGLEKKKLIERIADPEDGRWVRINVTARGLSNYQLVRREWAQAIAAAVKSDPKLPETLPMLTQIHAGLVRERRAAGQP